MSDSDRKGHPLSRRSLLKGATALSGAALLPLSAFNDTAQGSSKLSQAAVKYQDHPKGNKQCDKCIQYIAPKSKGGKAHCKVVKGVIEPHGYCIAFSPAKS